MHQKLINVNKSRIAIDSTCIMEKVFDEIGNQMEAYNSQEADDVIYYIDEEKKEVIYHSPQFDICSDIYKYYIMEICFGSNGLDTSLSTKIRHGSLVNQLFRTFTDNSIIINHSCNYYFDELEKQNKINAELKNELTKFSDNITNHL